MIIAIVYLVVGFILLVKGADFFVEGASSIAKKLHIPSIVIGLTIVAFGTSAPELAVSMSAALKGSNDIAIGNVVGSNIFNVLVVLGASAAITPVMVGKSIIRKDYPLCIFTTVLLGVLCLDVVLFQASSMKIGRMDGIILLIVFVIFMYWTLRDGLKERENLKQDAEQEENISMIKSVVITIAGLILIIIGADLAVDGAKDLARAFGFSEALIGLTIVAFGTSLPELVTSIVAARKGESDIAVGNVIGSNLFNILMILGVSATILPMKVSDTYIYDIVILTLVMVLTYIPIVRTKKVSRFMGIIMVGCYIVYTAYLIMR